MAKQMTSNPHPTPCTPPLCYAIGGSVSAAPRPCKPWLMPKPICVYSYDANPTYDQPKFHVSRHEAQVRMEYGTCRYVSDKAIQECPPANWQRYDSAGRFDEAWRMKPSAGVSVWQMRSQMGMSKDYVNE